MTVKTIGVFLFHEAEELDVVGPWEVLASWCQLWPEDGYRVVALSPDGEVVHCARGLRIVSDESKATAGPLTVLVHAGGPGTRKLLDDTEHLAWVREQRATAEILTSVCTGSLVYAAAGLLRHRSATTHWKSLDLLAQLDPTTTIMAGDQVVDDGDLITSAGVATGIDLALHLVARLAGHERSAAIRKAIQYESITGES